MLEVIDKGSATESHPAPLLFVHGAWHAAWCWDEHFLDFFADRGYRALAMSVRGHGGSSSPRPVRFCSLTNYVDDLVSVTDALPTKPVLVGHSMGGYIVQKYLGRGGTPAAVLMASASVKGSTAFALRLMRKHPWLMLRSTITGDAAYGFNTPAVTHTLFYSSATSPSDVERYAGMVGNESLRVAADTMRPIANPERVTTPVLVLGAALDSAITLDEVTATARAYRTQPEIFPDMGHNMMLEPGWASVAERIDAWLTGQGL
ncbi:lysophospholipase [Mycolicibacterium sp. 018/SC-01/001]|uniref:alpha/beta hydrolase n=1 Tax=Mycolicibacterium sp. 018/SC-01/001 TaxID=2592069 RepID=UPI00117ED136|nr:alpha/beta fold hydrolase [Mycolicibacterium sp. 018/SC-01/001]TRW77847.1 lysophospholipase [Mycolicibacterium sp. 018/SC-01/001]